MFRPFFLPLRVFLSPQGVDVMRDQGSRLIRGVSQTAARHPRLQAAWRRRATCVHKATDYIITMASPSDSTRSWVCLITQETVYPCSKCRRTRRSCQVRSAESGWLSSAAGVGRRRHVSERHESHSVNCGEWKQGIPVNSKASLPLCSQTSSPAACCDGCRRPSAPWRDCSGTWQSEGLTSNNRVSINLLYEAYLRVREMLQAAKQNYCRTSVMRDPFYGEWPGLPVEEQHSCVHIHRNSLSAVPHHLHLNTHKEMQLYCVDVPSNRP